jgi:hypothetical protein
VKKEVVMRLMEFLEVGEKGLVPIYKKLLPSM